MSLNQKKFREKTIIIIEELEAKAIEREVLSRLIILNFISSSNMFLIGAPGIAKSYLVKKAAFCIKDAKYFEYLMTSTTQEKELLGVPYEAEGGKIIYNTNDSVIDSHVVFIDEGFKAKSSVLNAFLGITSNDREFHQRGADRGVVKTEVRTFITASNEFSRGTEAQAFVDRLHFVYEPRRIIQPENYKKFLRGDFDKSNEFSQKLGIDEIDAIKVLSKDIIISDFIMDVILTIKDRMIKEGLEASDRKIENAKRIMQVSAFCNGRSNLDVSDVSLFIHLGWKDFTERDRTKEICLDTFFKTRSFFQGEVDKFEKFLVTQDNFVKNTLDDIFHKRVNLDPKNILANFPKWKTNAENVIVNYTEIEKGYLSILERFKSAEDVENQIRDNIFLTDILLEEELSVPSPYSRSFDDILVGAINDKIVHIRQTKKKVQHFLDVCPEPALYSDYSPI
jgi:MoxR-like ATPase